MRKVELRMNEEFKYKVIKKLIETDGNKKAASIKLKCTKRTINRLLQKYEQEGKAGFIHSNRGKKPVTTIQDSIKQKIIDLYITDYSDANFAHFCEIVNEELGYKLSDTTLNRWLHRV